MKLGMAMAARMPMIATTIMSSMRVKPFSFLAMRLVLLLGWVLQRRSRLRGLTPGYHQVMPAVLSMADANRQIPEHRGFPWQ